MKIFKIKLVFSKQEKYIDKNFYYSILWAVLNLFENNSQVYESILKISYSFDKNHLFVFISILNQENFNQALTLLLEQKSKDFSIDNYKFELENIDFNLKVLDVERIKAQDIERFELKFLSPTMIRNQNKIFTLPESKRFLFSVYNKIKILWFNFQIDEKDFKKYLEYAVLPTKFNLKTEKIKIKWSFRAGVVGNISYTIYEKNGNYQKIIYTILQFIPYIGLGSGTKLGLGNVKVN